MAENDKERDAALQEMADMLPAEDKEMIRRMNRWQIYFLRIWNLI